jgi:hypothetical protein
VKSGLERKAAADSPFAWMTRYFIYDEWKLLPRPQQ